MEYNDVFVTAEGARGRELNAAEPPRRTVMARFFAALGATDRTLMRNHPAPLITTLLVAVTTLAMLGAALGMFLL